VPPLGDRPVLSSDLLPGARKLAEAVRELIDILGYSYATLGRPSTYAEGVSPASKDTFNRLADGTIGSRSNAQAVRCLRSLAASRRPGGKIISEEALQELWDLAWDEKVQAKADAGRRSVLTAAPAGASPMPAAANAAADRFLHQHADAAVSGVAPVHPASGDRRNLTRPDVAWPVDDFVMFADRGEHGRAVGMLTHAGGTAPALEAAAAVAACRDRQLSDAAMTILRHAGKRPHPEILGIAGSLLDLSLCGDARQLIAFAEQA
jgi:hypothetical protein